MEEIRWRDLEYPHRPKSVDWYWGLGLLAIVLAVVSIFFGNLLLGILIIAGAATIGIFTVREPHEIDYVISSKGILINSDFHPYQDLESFFVDEQEKGTKLILVSKKFFTSYIIIDIKDHHPDTVRDFLLNKLPEIEHREPLLHAIAERLGI